METILSGRTVLIWFNRNIAGKRNRSLCVWKKEFREAFEAGGLRLFLAFQDTFSHSLPHSAGDHGDWQRRRFSRTIYIRNIIILFFFFLFFFAKRVGLEFNDVDDVGDGVPAPVSRDLPLCTAAETSNNEVLKFRRGEKKLHQPPCFY